MHQNVPRDRKITKISILTRFIRAKWANDEAKVSVNSLSPLLRKIKNFQSLITPKLKVGTY